MEVLKNLFQSTAANASNAKKNPRELVQALCSCFLQLKSNEKQSPKVCCACKPKLMQCIPCCHFLMCRSLLFFFCLVIHAIVTIYDVVIVIIVVVLWCCWYCNSYHSCHFLLLLLVLFQLLPILPLLLLRPLSSLPPLLLLFLKTLEDLSKLLEMAKVMIYGETDKEPKRQDILDFAQLACASELYLHLSSKMPAIEFEGKRFASQVFNHLLKVSHDSKLITVDYILLHPEILDYLLHGYVSVNSLWSEPSSSSSSYPTCPTGQACG